MTTPPIAISNPFYGEAPLVDILIKSQKTNLILATVTLIIAAVSLVGILVYVWLQGSLKVTEAGIASGLPLITGIVSKLGINATTAHIGELQAAKYLASLPSISSEQVAQFKALMAIKTA
jgi:hypothetical protein